MSTFLQKTLSMKTNFCKKKFDDISQLPQYTPTGLKWKGAANFRQIKRRKVQSKDTTFCRTITILLPILHSMKSTDFFALKTQKKSFGRWIVVKQKTIKKLTGYDIFLFEIYSALGRTCNAPKMVFFRLFPIISISQKIFLIFFLTLEKIGIDEKVICYHNISN